MLDAVTFRRVAREWLIGLMSIALVVAPFGCAVQTDLLNNLNLGGLGSSTAGKTTAGLFVNPDSSDPLLIAGRNAAGDAFFVYGTRTASGSIDDVQSILVQPKNGEESFIVFESGRPVYAQGPDGSYVKIQYTEISTTRLAGTATVHDGATGTTESTIVSIDLQQATQNIVQAASDAATLVQNATGRTLDVPQTPDAGNAKIYGRSASSIIIALSVIPLVFATQYLIVVMGEIMAEMIAVVTLAMQAVVLAAFTPLFLFTALLSDVTVNIQSVPLFDVFLTLPPAPTITIDIG